jgi:hypothetical protein
MADMKTELSPYVWLHHQEGKFADTILISSHGGSYINSPRLVLPPGVQVYFTAEDGDFSNLTIRNALAGHITMTAPITANKTDNLPDYHLTKFQKRADEAGPRDETYEVIEDAIDSSRENREQYLKNYDDMSKERHRLEQDVCEGNDDELSIKLASIRQLHGLEKRRPNILTDMDVITIRNRKSPFYRERVLLSHVVRVAQKFRPEYRTFICGFCRNLA